VDGVGVREVVAVRGFRLILGTRLSGQFGDGLLQASLATFVLFSPEREPTATRVALAFAILLLPYSLVGPFAGVLIDRWWRRTILVRANLLRALLLVGLAAIVAAGRDDAVLAVAVLVILGVNRFILASLSASLPHVVADRHLVTANAIAPTSGTIASVVGGLVGVGVRTLAGGGDAGSVVVLACALAAYVVAALVASRIAGPALGPDEGVVAESVRNVARGLVDGLRHLRERRPAARAIGLVMVHRAIFGMATALAVLQVRGLLHPEDPEAAIGALTVALGAAGLGAFAGAVVTPALAPRLGAVRWSAMALAGGILVGAFGFVLGSLPGLVLGGAFVGFAGQAVKVCSDTIVQEDVDDDRRGRVFSLYDVGVNVALVTGLTLAAYAAPSTGVAPGVAAAMAAVAAVGAWWALTAERRDPAASYAVDPVALAGEADGVRVEPTTPPTRDGRDEQH
jgi:MFS family permease